MSIKAADSLSGLYEADETAWLDEMVQLIRERRYEDLDFANLQEFLADMSRRDKREVRSRLTLLIAHQLKWERQNDKRTASWQATIAIQRRELKQLLESKVLRNFASDVLEEVYRDAVEQAALETGLAEAEFPGENPRTIDQWLSIQSPDE